MKQVFVNIFSLFRPEIDCTPEEEEEQKEETILKEEAEELDYSDENVSKLFPDVGDITHPNWSWPCYDQWYKCDGSWGIRKHANTNSNLKTNTWPFEVVYLIGVQGDREVFLRFRSPELTEIVKKSHPELDDDGSIFVGQDIDPKEIFIRQEGLSKYIISSVSNNDKQPEEGSENAFYVQHLLRFTKDHFKGALDRHERMKTEGRVSYDMLWTFLTPNVEVCYKCKISGQQCHGKVRRGNYSQCYFEVEVNVMDYDVEGYKEVKIDLQICRFLGEVPFSSLNVCPMSFYDKNKCMALEGRLLSMGTCFYNVSMKEQFCFMDYKGSLSHVDQWNVLRKLNADGRVMIDLLSFARMNPDYEMGNARPPSDVMVGTSKPECLQKPEDKELMMSPAIVYGFSFRLKKWGCFEVFGLRDISFDEGAFDALKLRNPSQKIMLKEITAQYVFSDAIDYHVNKKTINADPISGKGKGCVVLCHGPPGTGKTLTAEALAEEMKRPLWSMSASELGHTHSDLEKHLISVLDVATTWGAVLLLDEADAYLERRVEGVDVTRNLMTSVFLRVLEYHKGILFLTTNRVTSFDDAILSRMTLVISYPSLNDEQRIQIWTTSLARTGLCETNLIHIQALVRKYPLNGRQIRNIIHLACLSAHIRKDCITMKDVEDAIDTFLGGIRSLSSGAEIPK